MDESKSGGVSEESSERFTADESAAVDTVSQERKVITGASTLSNSGISMPRAREMPHPQVMVMVIVIRIVIVMVIVIIIIIKVIIIK